MLIVVFMVTCTLPQSVWEFAKLRTIRGMRASMVYMPMCKTRASFSFLRVNVPHTCHKRGNVRMLCQLFNFACQRVYQFFNYFSKEFFNFWIFRLCSTFSNFKNICAILENLSRETKNSNFDICKISLRKNLANLKHLTLFSMGHVGLRERLFGLGKTELNIYIFYLPNFVRGV